jgi:tetratricopeptide (TPR) repeat protein
MRPWLAQGRIRTDDRRSFDRAKGVVAVTIVVFLAAAALAVVAAFVVLRPFGRDRSLRLEALTDPLEEERVSLLRALRTLDDDRATGVLSPEDHRALRTETEVRAVGVLRALEARDGQGDLPSALRELRPPATTEPRSRTRAFVPVTVVLAVLAALAVPLLTDAVRDRGAGQPISGGSESLAFFEQRVRDHPGDLAARLDLAQRYLQIGDVEGGVEQYLAALEIEPDNPEARATLGFLLHRGGSSEEGLAEVDRALQLAPQDPEALYFKGLILLDGLDRPAQAAKAFRAYLEVAPFGARRAEVEDLLAESESEAERTG